MSSASIFRITRGSLYLLTILALFAITNSAAAHALLTRSLPAAAAELTSAPNTIELWFSEPIEAKFSSARFVDAQGNEIGAGTSLLDTTDPTHMTLSLAPVPPGIYTVIYRNLSQTDGHEWIGSFPVTVLNANGTRPAAAPAQSAELADAQQTVLPTPLAISSRWLALMGAMLLFGVLFFEQIAANVTVPKQGELPAQKFNDALQQSLTLGLSSGLTALLLGMMLHLAVQLQSLGNSGKVIELLTGTRTGNLLLLRTVLIGVLLVDAILLSGRKPTQRARWIAPRNWLRWLLSGAILATFSLSSHAVAVAGSGWAITVDFVHLGAAALWLGGLALLASLLWRLRDQPAAEDTAALKQLVWRFSTIATLAVFVLVASGLFSSLVQLHSFALLWTSTYGWLLLAKVLLICLTMAIALRNHRLVRGKTTNPPDWTKTNYRSFLRQVGGESLVGLAIMFVVAMLVQTPPPQAPSPPTAAKEANYFAAILSADDLTIHLQILPNQVGDNQYVTHLYHGDSSAIGDVQLVRLAFAHQSAELGQASLDLTAKGNGLFDGKGAYLNRAGWWDVSVYVRRRGMDDALVKTAVAVPSPNESTISDRQPWQNPIPTLPPSIVVGGVIVALILAIVIWRRVRSIK